MSALACNIVLYRPDPDLLAARFNYWHLEALLHQADTLITRCLGDFNDYSHLDYAWNQFELDLETQEKKLGLYNPPSEKDIFDRDVTQDSTDISAAKLETPEESEILTLVEPVEADQPVTEPAVSAGLRSSLDFRTEAFQRKKALSAPGRPFALYEQRDLALQRVCRDYEEAVNRACVAEEGLRKLYQRDGEASPLPSEAETLGASLTALSTWIRNSLEWLVAYHQREHAFTRVVSVRSLLNRNGWALVKHSRDSYLARLQVPADLFRGYDNCHVRGVAASLVGEAGTVPWTILLRLPDEAVFEKSGQSVEIDQSGRPACLLGRVENRRAARHPELCGADSLLDASPMGRSNQGGIWTLEIVKPVGANSESFSHLEDVVLEIRVAGIPQKTAG
jgi:hypothetical protein